MKNSTMMAQPSFNIFRSKETRHYNIFVNEAITTNGISYKDLTFNALVGWYGHEIAHLTDYKHRSLIEMAIYGIRYTLSGKFMKKIEYQTDSTTIAHGLGCQLLEGVEFCMQSEKIAPVYRWKLIKYYMSPSQIKEGIHNWFVKRTDRK